MQPAAVLPNELAAIIISHACKPFPYGLVCKDWYDMVAEEADRRAHASTDDILWTPIFTPSFVTRSAWSYLAICTRGFDMARINTKERCLTIVDILHRLCVADLPLAQHETVIDRVLQATLASEMDAQAARALVTLSDGGAWCRALIAVEKAGLIHAVSVDIHQADMRHITAEYREAILAVYRKCGM